jgi:hypothetical protein
MSITVATCSHRFLCGVRLFAAYRGQHSYPVRPDITPPNPRGSCTDGCTKASKCT